MGTIAVNQIKSIKEKRKRMLSKKHKSNRSGLRVHYIKASVSDAGGLAALEDVLDFKKRVKNRINEHKHAGKQSDDETGETNHRGKSQSAFLEIYIKSQMANGYEYFWIKYGDKIAGYTVLHPYGEKLYVSELNLLAIYNRNEIAEANFNFYINEARRRGAQILYLNSDAGLSTHYKSYNYNGITVYEE